MKRFSVFICVFCSVIFFLQTHLSFAGRVCPCNCECNDISSIRKRIVEIDGAIKGYEAAKRRYGRITMFSLERYNNEMQPSVQQSLQNELNASQFKGAGTGAGAETSPMTCGITIDYNGSFCIQESLRRHELVHQAECIRITGRSGATGSVKGVAESALIGEYADYRTLMTMTKVADEEIRAYTIELNYLNSQLACLMNICKSNGNLSFSGEVRGYCEEPDSADEMGRQYTCERKRLTSIGGASETWNKLRDMFFGD